MLESQSGQIGSRQNGISRRSDMKIQSLSVVVPNKKCINDCKFCVSKMHTEDYKNQLDYNLPFYDLYIKDYLKRLEFARDNGCNNLMLTGNSEPQQNRHFLMMFGLLNQMLEKPFRNIEMQTTGTMLDENYLRFLRNHVGVTTISVSLSSFHSGVNADITGMAVPVHIPSLCQFIKKYDFILRLSINLTSWFDDIPAEDLIKWCDELGADQITFRVLYSADNNTPQSKWIAENSASKSKVDEIKNYILQNGRFLDVLEFGQKRYSVNGMSTIIDDDCMSKEAKDTAKYLILRPDCKLYSKWDDKGSVVF